MIIYPAIDIRGGKCVRLTEGRFDQETVFADNPVDMAVRWEKEGASFLHLVDLDGALQGKPVNDNVISKILQQVSIPVQVGGGIRTLAAVSQYLEMGVQRVILGSVAVKNPELVQEACQHFPKQIIVGIDAKDGQAAIEGWGTGSGTDIFSLAKHMHAAGVTRFIFTDISRDGKLCGVNAETTNELAKSTGAAVIASGGVTNVQDLRHLKQMGTIEGAIIGKALYMGTLSLEEALAAAREEV